MIINEIVVDKVVRFRLVLASKYTISFKDTNTAYFIKTFNAAVIITCRTSHSQLN